MLSGLLREGLICGNLFEDLCFLLDINIDFE